MEIRVNKHIVVTCCGDCPYNDAPIDNKTWYCMEPSGIDSDGIGILLGGNKIEILQSIPGWCPLGDYEND